MFIFATMLMTAFNRFSPHRISPPSPAPAYEPLYPPLPVPAHGPVYPPPTNHDRQRPGHAKQLGRARPQRCKRVIVFTGSAFLLLAGISFWCVVAQ